MAPVLDGYPAHLAEMTPDRRFETADLPEPSSDDVIRHLDQTGTDVLVNYLPVCIQQATEFFAECAVRASVAFVNAMPVFIASDPVWGRRFAEAAWPVIGESIKAQLGTMIVQEAMTEVL